MILRLFIAVVLLAGIVGGIVFFNDFRAKMIAEYLGGMVPPPVPVTTQEARPIDWTPGIDAIGTSLSVQGVDLAIESGGTVRGILFRGNDKVTKGQHLVQIDDSSEVASLAAAKAGLNVAETELRRTQTLTDRGVNAQTTVDTAAAQAESARAQVAQVQTSLDNKRLAAPFDGVIGIPQIEIGQYVTPGTVYATLQDLTKMRVDFNVPEQQIAALQLGGAVTVTTEVGDLSARGTIIAIEPRVDAASRMITVRAEVENTEGKLIPGQFLRVRVELPLEKGVIALPQTAVTTSLYGDTVYVVRSKPAEPAKDAAASGTGDAGTAASGTGAEEQLTAEQVFVTTGRRFGGQIEIVKGIAAGDMIVTSGQNRLSNGSRVKVDNSVHLPQSAGQ
ncbi:MAG: efflux RND transporter periplasmic adaptor subunit [Paracoccaceae bacterium]